jgi:hypothetical protein
MSIKARLAKLERGSPSDDIPVWCDEESDVAATIRAMVAAGEIAKTDVGRCVFWTIAKARTGAHEGALAELP